MVARRGIAELMIVLPRDWAGIRADGTLDAAAMEEEANWWPVRAIKRLARLPQEGVMLAPGLLLPDDRGALAPSTALSHLMVGPSRLHPRSASLMVHDDVVIEFHALWALHAEEAEFRQAAGMESLVRELWREGVTELVDVRRAGVLKAVPQRA